MAGETAQTTSGTNQSASAGQSQSQSADQGAQAAASQTTQGSQASTTTQTATAAPEWKRREYVPAAIANADEEERYIRETVARDAAVQSRKLTLPTKPEDYKFGLSPNFKAPQGLEFKLNEADPMVAQYRAFAHKHGLDQAQFTEGLDLIAAVRLGDEQTFQSAKTAELGKLGPNAAARITAVTQWLAASAGDKAAGMIKVLEMAPRADTIEAFEGIIQKSQSQGAAPFNGSGRTQSDPAQIQGYEQMNFAQRRAAQDALARQRKTG